MIRETSVPVTLATYLAPSATVRNGIVVVYASMKCDCKLFACDMIDFLFAKKEHTTIAASMRQEGHRRTRVLSFVRPTQSNKSETIIDTSNMRTHGHKN